ncbi:hypothetical protein [Finegoldia magna]|uniref:hypothetical protein n=1 Tax=Finegoldia magna TaxID=1260 RepID=UPI002901E365|nr:hypothetical protein [Finegoldia magna]MDU1213917.1 hypothetical protein [Finegoldia magna]
MDNKKEYKTSEARRRANSKWDKANKDKFKRFNIVFNISEDKEIIDFLYSQENKNQFIKNLLKNELKKI